MKTRYSRASQVLVDSKSRRMFLKSAGGFTLAIPFLPSLLTAYSEKALADSGPPLRYVQLFTGLGGLQHKNWLGTQLPANIFELYPGQNARKDLLANLITSNGLSTVLDSNFRNLFPYMNLIAGLDSSIYWGHNRAVGTGAFAANYQNYQSLSDQQPLGPFIDQEFPTIDQVLGYAGTNGIYGSAISGRHRHLNISSSGFTSSWGRDDYFNSSAPVLPKDTIGSSSGVFNYLFGSIQQNQSQNSTNPLLNLVNEFWPSGKSLFKFLSGADKTALDNLFQIAQQASNEYSGPMPVINGVSQPQNMSDLWQDDGTSLRAVADIITMAFQSDVNRVVTFHAGDALGLPWHSLSHAPSTNNPNAGQEGIIRIHSNIAQNFFAYLGERLRTTMDSSMSGSSLLDNSLLMWTQEHKVAHDNLSIPTVLLGGAGGRINTGNFVDFRNFDKSVYTDITGDMVYEGEMVNRLWASLFYAFNIPRTTYEIARSGPEAQSLSKGYGHVLKNTASWYHSANYNLSMLGEPWDFLKKSTTTW